MKKLLPILLLAGFSTAVHAGGLSTRHSTSLQLAIDGGSTEYTRMGASYSISGTNVTTSHTVGTGDDAETTTGGLGVQSYAATGVATPGTITNGHVVTISQGVTANGQTTGTLGAGSQITAQFVGEITAF